jgi:hypothetical protein
MIRTQGCLIDRQRLAKERLGLAKPTRIAQNFRKIVEFDRVIGMTWAVNRLVDGEGASSKRLGLAEAVGRCEQEREVAEADRDMRVTRA